MPRFKRNLVRLAAHPDAGIVEQVVEAAALVREFDDRCADCRWVANVEREAGGTMAALVGDALGTGGVVMLQAQTVVPLAWSRASRRNSSAPTDRRP